MSSLNKVILIGNLGQDPELQYTNNQTPVVRLSVATTTVYKDRDGHRNEKTEWHRVVVWNKQAENCAKYLSKGSKVLIEGELTTRSFDDQKTGEKRYFTEVRAKDVKFMSSAKKGEEAGDDSAPMTEDDLENIPF